MYLYTTKNWLDFVSHISGSGSVNFLKYSSTKLFFLHKWASKNWLNMHVHWVTWVEEPTPAVLQTSFVSCTRSWALSVETRISPAPQTHPVNADHGSPRTKISSCDAQFPCRGYAIVKIWQQMQSQLITMEAGALGASERGTVTVRTPFLPESAWPFSRRRCLSTHLSESAK